MKLTIPCLCFMLLAHTLALGDEHNQDSVTKKLIFGGKLTSVSRNLTFLEPCQVELKTKLKCSINVLFGLHDEKKKQVMFVVLPERFGLGVVLMKASYGGIEITPPDGVDFPLSGPRSVVFECKKYAELKAALEKRYEYGHVRDDGEELDSEPTVSLRVLLLKKFPNFPDDGDKAETQGYGNCPHP